MLHFIGWHVWLRQARIHGSYSGVWRFLLQKMWEWQIHMLLL